MEGGKETTRLLLLLTQLIIVGLAGGRDCADHVKKSGPGDLEKADDSDQPNESRVIKDLRRAADAMSEIPSSSAGYELAFSMVPGRMKSAMQTVFMTTGAVGAGLSIPISPTYKDPEMLSIRSSLAIVKAHHYKCPNRVSPSRE
ncbi:oligopeptide transporter [Colletotrichum sojae]|uniref:Oligopeptide transporter n=1 Tax=Colletotrichum sojae TaxID=2175907 RepID=A0A8H6JLR1_9PEZI|nr:oligopeptide transporter [Colletotrichum sojae]